MKTPMQELFSQLEIEHPELFNAKPMLADVIYPFRAWDAHNIKK